MFDYIYCERELPFVPEELIWKWNGANKISFQTKDLDLSLSSFKISKEGELLKRNVEIIVVSDGDPDAESIMDRFPKTEHVCKGWVETKHTGNVCFYDSYKYAEKTDHSGWVEYKAKFVDGLLQGEIKLSEHTLPRNRTEEEWNRIYEAQQHYAKIREDKIALQLESFNAAKKQIAALSETQDYIFKNLLSQLPTYVQNNAEEWLWDYVYNDTEYSLQKLKEYL